MPLYDYHCPKCNAQVEILVRNAKENPACPQCGSLKLERQLSVAAAPAISGKNLPVAQPGGGGCGKPQCASGRCMFDS
jgi:putative FmdB family regulatory protein